MNRTELLNVTVSLATALTERGGNQVMAERIPELVQNAKTLLLEVDRVYKESIVETPSTKQMLMENVEYITKAEKRLKFELERQKRREEINQTLTEINEAMEICQKDADIARIQALETPNTFMTKDEEDLHAALNNLLSRKA